MISKFIINKIEKDCKEYDVVVLKGFANNLVIELRKTYNLLDYSIFEDYQICLDKINNSQFLMDVINYNGSKIAICTYESFLALCSKFQSIEILNKKFCVLENNLFELYPNPTGISIPDFDSKQFEEVEGTSPIYSLFYSYCIHVEGVEYIQYIDSCFYEHHIKRISLVEPIQFNDCGIVNTIGENLYISTQDGSLDIL